MCAYVVSERCKDDLAKLPSHLGLEVVDGFTPATKPHIIQCFPQVCSRQPEWYEINYL